MKQTIGMLLFEDFEVLDLFGPVELFGMRPEAFELVMVAAMPGPVRSAQGPTVLADAGFDDERVFDVLLVPGGQGTRRAIDDDETIAWLRSRAATAAHVTSVCTGASLLARAGILDGRRATTNKMNFAWVESQGPSVDWVYEARWVEDGNVLTSSGVSAGMDMSLALIARILGQPAADDAALWAEYGWQQDSTQDPFAAAWAEARSN